MKIRYDSNKVRIEAVALTRNVKSDIFSLSLWLPLFFVCIFATDSFAVTRTVPAQHASISAAITASANGDVVVVSAGTYSENIDFGSKVITIQSASGAASTIIQGAGGDLPVVRFNNAALTSAAVLDGFTIDSLSTSGNNRRGVYIGGGAAPTIKNTIIKGNAPASYVPGAGIYITGGGATIDNVTIGVSGEPNAGAAGGGIYAAGGGSALAISNSTVSYNTSGAMGGGLYLTNNGITTTITNSTISHNTSAQNGGGIYSSSSPITINTSTIDNNTTINNGQLGGGLYLTGAATVVTLTFTDVTANTATLGSGGGGYIAGTASMNMTGGTISGNTAGAAASGGGISMTGAGTTASLNKVKVSGNSTGQYGGGLYLNSSSSLSVTNSIISGNIAEGQAYSDGGGINNGGGTLTLMNSTIAGNYAFRNGGGLTGGATVTNSIFWGNTAGNTGPQISSAPTVTYSDISGGFTGTGNINSDPLFVTMAQAGSGAPTTAGDFNLQASSPVIDLGTATGAPADDIDGGSRSGNPDMGAHEYNLGGVADSTTAGTATAAVVSPTSIAVSMPYSDDGNANNTYTIDYKLSSAGSWTSLVAAAAHAGSPYQTTITGLTTDASYDVRVTYNDVDTVSGTNPQIISNVTPIMVTYTVTTNAEATDGTCNATCSLREAIDAANAAPDLNQITLPAGTYTISLPGTDNTNAAGDFDITNPVNIVGAGSGSTFIRAAVDLASAADRIFHVTNSSDLTLEALTVQNGKVTGSGGCIYSTGDLTIKDSVVDSCTANGTNNGGAIYSLRSVSLNNATVSNGTSTANGGGIYTTGLTITNGATISNNYANDRAGGVYNATNDIVMAGNVVFTNNDSLRNHTTDSGGAIWSSGNITHSGGTINFTNNDAYQGGAIYIDDATKTVLLNAVTLNANTATTNAGGIYSYGLTITGGISATGNSANDRGGAIRNITGALSIDGAILFDNNDSLRNHTTDHGGAIWSSGDLTLNPTTGAATFQNNDAYNGGAIYLDAGKTLTAGEVSFIGNTGTNIGGAIQAYGITIAGPATFQNNSVSNDGGAIYNQVNAVNINGVILFDNNDAGTASGDYGGAIYSDADVTLNDVSGSSTFQNSQAYSGGAIYISTLYAPTLTLNNATFDANNTVDVGGAIYTRGGTMSDVTFTNNYTANDGGAIYNVSRPLIINGTSNTFTNNHAGIASGDNGGAIFSSNPLDISNATFTGRNDGTADAYQGGAIYLSYTGDTLALSNASFSNFRAVDVGGALRMYGGTLGDVTFTGNFSETTNGGAIFNAADPLIINGTSNTFTGNYAGIGAGDYGGAIYSTGTVTVSNAAFTGRNDGISDAYDGGAIYVWLDAAVLTVSDSSFASFKVENWGGAIRMYGGTMTNVTFTDNVAGNDAGAILNGLAPLTISGTNTFTNNSSGITSGDYGGALYSTSDLTVSGATFTNNDAYEGGAIYMSVTTTLTIDDSTFTSNTAANVGGAIRNSGVVLINSSTFAGNSTVGGGHDGGAIFSSHTLDINNSTFSGNSVADTAGAIYQDGTAVIRNSTFYNNNAGVADAIYRLAGTVTLYNTIVTQPVDVGTNLCSGVTSGDYNLQFNGTCFAANTNDISGVDPLLSALASNGGLTQTHAISPASPATDAGLNAVCAAAPISNLDQRNSFRPFDGDGDLTSTCDIGAYEYIPSNFAPIGGFTSANQIPVAQISQATDGSGLLTINFRVQDADGDNVTLKTFQYSDDGGTTWYAPTNGDASTALAGGWSGSFSSATNWSGTVHSFTFDTDHVDAPLTTDLDQSDIRVRFTLNDGTVDSSPVAAAANFQVDNLTPTATITSAVYNAIANELVITGSNLDTIDTVSTDIKSSVDWSKFVWDINGDDAVTTNAIFDGSGVASLTITNATTLTMALTTGKASIIELIAGYGAAGGADTLDVAAGFTKDTFGNVSTTDGAINASLSTNGAPVGGYAGDNVIPLAQVTQSTAGDGVVTVKWKGRDNESENVTLNSFEYSVDGGTAWVANSTALSAGWADNGGGGYATEATFGAAVEHTFTFNTQHGDLVGLGGIDQTDVRVRFRLNDGNSDSAQPLTSVNFTVDNLSPTATITSAEYNSLTNELVLIGTNFITIDSASTDIAATVDWSKLVWDINGDDAVTTNIIFDGSGVSSLVITNTTTLTVSFTTAKSDAIEAAAGYGATAGIDTVDVTAGFTRDAFGNISTGDGVVDAPLDSNKAPAGGYTIDNEIPLAQVSQSTAGDGVVTINWKARDTESSNVTLNSFEYSVDGGSSWIANSTALTATWSDNGGSGYAAAATLAAAPIHSFTFNAQHGDLVGLDGIDQGDVRVRFTVNDGEKDSISPVESVDFQVDNVVPIATISSASYTPATNTLVITGTDFTSIAAATTEIKPYVDWAKFSWDINGDNAVTADVNDIVVGDIVSLKVTNDTTLTLVLSVAKSTSLEGNADFGSTGGGDTLDITTGFIKDSKGNVAATDGVADAAIGIVIIDSNFFTQTNWGWGVLDETACGVNGGTWAGGQCVATHSNNLAGWMAYISKDANLIGLNADADLGLASQPNSMGHQSSQDFNTGTPSGVNIKGSKLTLDAISRTVSWEATPTFTLTPGDTDIQYVSLGDFDGDGDIDIMVAPAWDSWMKGYINDVNNDSPNTWTRAPTSWDINRGSNAWIKGRSGDVNNDGRVDIVFSDVVYENGGPDGGGGIIWTQRAWQPGELLFDLDGDDDLDSIEYVGDTFSTLQGYENTASSGAPNYVNKDVWDASLYTFWNPLPMLIDIDGDGDPELVQNSTVASKSQILYENTGDGLGAVSWADLTASRSTWLPLTGANDYIQTMDMNGDELPDAIVGQANSIKYYQNTTVVDYPVSGTYLSEVMDFGIHAGFTTLDYTASEFGSSSLLVEVRAGNDQAAPAAWPVQWVTVADGGSTSALGVYRYAQYRVTLTAGLFNSRETTPVLRDITFNYSTISSPHALISSWFNSEQVSNYLWSLGWTETLPAGAEVRIQMRSAADAAGAPGTPTAWIGPDGTNGSYWSSANTFAGGCSGSGSITCTGMPAALIDGANNQWLQYQVILVAGAGTPLFSDITLEYNTVEPAGITVSKLSGLATSENLISDSFTVVLNTIPTGTVSVSVSANPADEVSLSTSGFSFDFSNWDQPVTVTVTGADDAIADGDTPFTINLDPSSVGDVNYNALGTIGVTGTNVNNDVVGMTVTSAATLFTSEAGGSATFTVQIGTMPTTDVILLLSSSNISEGTVSPSQITFNSSNWNTPQTVTVRGADDGVDDGDVNYTVLLHPTFSGDPNYHGVDLTDIAAVNADDDVKSVIATPVSGLTTSEAGGSASFTVMLGAAPGANVTLNLDSDTPTEGFAQPAVVTFNGNNWNVPQVVTVYGVDDTVDDGDAPYNIVVTADSADPAYGAMSAVNVLISNGDDDGPSTASNSFSQSTWGSATPANSVTCAAVNGTWDGGSCIATATSNQSGWDTYSSISSNMTAVNAGFDLQLVEGEQFVTHTLSNDFDAELSLDVTHNTSAQFSAAETITDVTTSGDEIRLNSTLSGSLTSQPLDVGIHSGYSTVEFRMVRPADTTVKVELRAADNSGFTDNATSWITVHDGDDISDLGSRLFVKYQVSMTSASTSVTPELEQIIINYNQRPLVSGVAEPVATDVVVTGDRISLDVLSRTVAWPATPTFNFYMADPNSDLMRPALGDFDGDGDIDIMVAPAWDTTVKGLRNMGDNTFERWDRFDLWVQAANWLTVRSGDLDQDGDPDLVANGQGYRNDGLNQNGEIIWVAQSGWASPDGSMGGRELLTDLDADGDLDLLDWNSGTWSDFKAFENISQGGTPNWVRRSTWDETTGGFWNANPSAADLDGDGIPEIIQNDTANGKAQMLFQGSFDGSTVSWTDITASRASWLPATASGDWVLTDYFNGDETPDAIVGLANNVEYYQSSTVINYPASGTYDSAILDFNQHLGFTTLNYNSTELGGSSIAVSVRAGNTEANPGAWPVQWQTVTNGGSLAAFDAYRYLQYRVVLTAGSANTRTPTLEDITLGYNSVANEGVLISSAFNTQTASALVTSLSWTEQLQANTAVKVQLRTAADSSGKPGVWSEWGGPDGYAGSYWNSVNTFSGGCVDTSGAISCAPMPVAVRNGKSNQWLQYKVTLLSDGALTPDFRDVSIGYAAGTTVADISVTPTTLTTSEVGGSVTFDVRITGVAPTSNVTVDLAVEDPSEGRLSTQQLIFTPADYSPRTVTVTPVDDSIDDGTVVYNVFTSVSESADNYYDSRVLDDVVVTNSDDETGGAGFTVTPTVGLSVTEAGSQASFTVTPLTAPSSSVTVAVHSSDGSEVSLSTSELTFAAGSTLSQTVTLTGKQDLLVDNDVAYTIVLNPAVSSDGNYSGLDPDDVSATTTDDDSAGIVVTGGPFTTNEDGGSDMVWIKLTNQPTHSVTFGLSVSDGTEGRVNRSSMTFTTSNWDTARWILVSGNEDFDADGNVAYSIITSPFTSDDLNFASLNPQDIPVVNNDNEAVSVSLTMTDALTTSESGGSDSFSIRLGVRPTHDVIFSFTNNDAGEGSLPSTVVISPDGSGWDGTGVTIVGVDDAINDSDQVYTIDGSYTSDDPSYSSGTLPQLTVTNLSTNTSYVEVVQAGAHAGRSVAFAELNGDAFPDMVVGVPGYNSNAGRVEVYYGTGGVYNTLPARVISGVTAGDFFGYSVANAGDVDNDGYDDLIIGAYGRNALQGEAYIFRGSSTGINTTAARTFTGSVAGDRFGFSVAAAGDVNNDAFADVIIGAYGSDSGRGLAEVYHGANPVSAMSLGWSATGSQAGENFAYSVSSAGNVDNANFDDVIVGAPAYANGQAAEGRAYVYLSQAGASGLNSGATWMGESDFAGAAYGTAVALAGDIDNDGFSDVMVGAPGYDDGAQTAEGWVFAYHGSISGPSISHDVALQGNQAGVSFGYALAALGDVNLDGYGDIAVGAPLYDNGEADEGVVMTFHGSAATLATSAATIYESNQANASMGYSVAGNADLNLDGYSDLLAGAHLFDNALADQGRVFVYRTAPVIKGVRASNATALQTSEAGGIAWFDIALTAPPAADVVVTLSSNNPLEGTLNNSVFLFTPLNWNDTQRAFITGQDDALDDDTVSYTITGVTSSAESGYDGLVMANVQVDNLDDDTSVTVLASDAAADEASVDTGTFTIFRTAPFDTALTVNYIMGGSANAADYSALSGSVVIPATQSSVSVTLVPVNDAIDEVTETASLTLTADAAYIVASPASANINITDDDTASITVTPTSGLITTEAGGVDTFTVVLGSQPLDDVTISLSSNDATEGGVLPASLVFTAANWNAARTVTVVGLDDGIVDIDTGYTILTSVSSAGDSLYNSMAIDNVTVTNIDDETNTNVSVTATVANIFENSGGNGLFTFRRVGSTAATLTVNYFVYGGAVSGTDYSALSGTVNILAGDTETTVAVTPVNDADFEGSETVVVGLSVGAGYVIEQPNSATITILDDELPPVPVADFAIDQSVEEVASITVNVHLSQTEAIVYPVTIPYTVSGTAVNGDDHNAVDGTVTINSPDTSGSIVFAAVNDGFGDADETVIFTMGTPGNADAGGRTTHTVTLIEANVPPTVALTSSQAAADSRLVVISGGNVTVTAAVADPNPGDTQAYSWAGTDALLSDIDGDLINNTFLFDPSGLTDGFYNLVLTVTDSGAAATAVEILLEVVTTTPVLLITDSDGDGISDSDESFDDVDGDGIPNYLDTDVLKANELQVSSSNPDSDGYIMRTNPGLVLRLGDVAFAAGADGAEVSADDIVNFGDNEGGSGANAVDSVPNVVGYFDFEVAGLTEAGQSVQIVLPVLQPIPASATYRKYDPVSGWSEFVVDAKNSLSSALGSPGECPLPGDAAYTVGLTTGHHCIQLMIEDGGSNDTDGKVNYVVVDPGEVASQSVTATTSSASTAGAVGGSGGGAVNFWLLLPLMLFALFKMVLFSRKSVY